MESKCFNHNFKQVSYKSQHISASPNGFVIPRRCPFPRFQFDEFVYENVRPLLNVAVTLDANSCIRKFLSRGNDRPSYPQRRKRIYASRPPRDARSRCISHAMSQLPV